MRPMKRVLLILMIVWGGGGKLFYEGMNLSPENKTSLSWGNRFEQQLICGVLGGWRPVVADLAWLRVTTSWESRQWSRLHENIRMAVRMQPESLLFWDIGAWHLAWNASLGERNNRLESQMEKRHERELYWIEQGRSLLEEGVRYHPNHFKIWLQLGLLHQERRHDFGAAYDCFLRASHLEGAPGYVARLAGYALEKQGDRARALEYWNDLLERSSNPADRTLIEKRLLKLEKDSMISPLKPLP